MADFKQRPRLSSRTSLELRQAKRQGMTEAQTEMVMAQLREMYPDQYVNKYPISKRRDEWAPMVSVLGENLSLFEQRRKEANSQSDMSEFIPPTTEKLVAPFISEGAQKYYTIFGEGKTELMLPETTSLIDIRWNMTYPPEGFEEAFRLNLRENGKAGSITLSPMESRIQRAKVRSVIDRIRSTRAVEYGMRQNDAYNVLKLLEKTGEKEVTVSFSAINDAVQFTAGGDTASLNITAFPHGRHSKRDEYAVYRTADLADAFASYLSSDFVSSAYISFGSDRLFTMRFNVVEAKPGYVKHPIRELEAMNREAQEKAREVKAQGEVMIMAAPSGTAGRSENLPLGSLGNSRRKKPAPKKRR